MKKALSDKKKKTVKESLDSKITAARHEGRADGLRGLRHRGKHYDEMEESKAYHEAYTNGAILVPLFRVLDAIARNGKQYESC